MINANLRPLAYEQHNMIKQTITSLAQQNRGI